jgi:hypothetical protein
MGVGRADEVGMGLARQVDVVGVAALAGDEAVIFLALNAGANSCFSHDRFL